MHENLVREEFDTGLGKIRLEIKVRLASQGLYGTVRDIEIGPTSTEPSGITIELLVKGRTAERSFNRGQIEGCRLRVGGEVLSAIISMVDEVRA